jgi:hypothetical protein
MTGAALVPMLEALDGIPCMSVHALAWSVAPPPLNAHGHVDGRTRVGKAWLKQVLDLIEASLDLRDAGLAEVVVESDGGRPYEIGITDAGRRYLAQMRAL